MRETGFVTVFTVGFHWYKVKTKQNWSVRLEIGSQMRKLSLYIGSVSKGETCLLNSLGDSDGVKQRRACAPPAQDSLEGQQGLGAFLHTSREWSEETSEEVSLLPCYQCFSMIWGWAGAEKVLEHAGVAGRWCRQLVALKCSCCLDKDGPAEACVARWSKIVWLWGCQSQCNIGRRQSTEENILPLSPSALMPWHLWNPERTPGSEEMRFLPLES